MGLVFGGLADVSTELFSETTFFESASGKFHFTFLVSFYDKVILLSLLIINAYVLRTRKSTNLSSTGRNYIKYLVD